MADEQGASFLSLFTTFGTFSIAAGIMLIFLIFVMLAAERRTEMGIARAVGTRRGHLVEGFVFEGVAYDVVAAAVGAALGLAVAYAIVSAIATALSATSDIELSFSVEPRSVIVAYALGVVLTLAVVAVSAWRVSAFEHRRRRPEPSSRGLRAFRPTGAMGRHRARRRWCSPHPGGCLGQAGDAAHVGTVALGDRGRGARTLVRGRGADRLHGSRHSRWWCSCCCRSTTTEASSPACRWTSPPGSWPVSSSCSARCGSSRTTTDSSSAA